MEFQTHLNILGHTRENKELTNNKNHNSDTHKCTPC